MACESVILCVLAGGRSRRFRASTRSGQSKLNIRIGDQPVLAWLLQRLGPALVAELHRLRLVASGPASPLPMRVARYERSANFPEKKVSSPPSARLHRWLNLVPGLQTPPGASCFERWIVDAQAYAGPLAGMRTVLHEACALGAESRVVFVGVDAPAISEPLVARMLRRSAQAPDAIAVMGARMSDAHHRIVEPLPSVWRAGAGVELIDRAMQQNVRGPSRLAGRAGVVLESIHALEMPGYLNINEARDMREASRVLQRVVSVSS